VSPAADASRPRLSVIVPTWNECECLPTLAAALAAQFVAHEWLVVDGGSEDGTAARAECLGATVVRAPRGRGQQLARGAELARGELLLFLHADASLGAGALDALCAAFDDPNLDAAGMHQVIDHPARFYRWVERAADARVRRGWVYGDSALCVRRAAYEAAGGFRPVPLFEDLDLSRRLRSRGRITLVREATVVCSPRRWEREGRLRRTLKNWILTGLWFSGVAPERLARFYAPHG